MTTACTLNVLPLAIIMNVGFKFAAKAGISFGKDDLVIPTMSANVKMAWIMVALGNVITELSTFNLKMNILLFCFIPGTPTKVG